jgi:glucokinase
MPSRLRPPVLVADIGGTNARFALAAGDGTLSAPVRLAVAEHESLEAALQRSVLPQFAEPPQSAMIAVAAVIDKERTQLTNAPWVIEPAKLIDVFGLGEIALLNDFEALSLSLPYLSGADLATVGDGIRLANEPKLVVGAGTGLGVAALVPVDGRWLPIDTECGHIDFGPIDRRDFELWPHLTDDHSRVSAEMVLSGGGIERLYLAICRADGTASQSRAAAEIVELAERNSDPAAVETIERFAAYLGRLAGSLALVFLARGGVYVGGGIAPRIRRFIEHGGFRQAFVDKWPFESLVASIATSIIIEPDPALRGLAAFVRDPDMFATDFTTHRKQRST